jgi:hypothetical protein
MESFALLLLRQVSIHCLKRTVHPRRPFRAIDFHDSIGDFATVRKQRSCVDVLAFTHAVLPRSLSQFGEPRDLMNTKQIK